MCCFPFLGGGVFLFLVVNFFLEKNLHFLHFSIYIYINMVPPPPPSDLPFFALSQVTQLHCKQTRCAI